MNLFEQAVDQALSGASNEECVKFMADSLSYGDSDVFAYQLSLLISTFAFKLYPIRYIDTVEQDRLLLMFANRSAALRLIRKEKKDADEFGEAVDALGIPRDQAFTVLAGCKHVLEDENG